MQQGWISAGCSAQSRGAHNPDLRAVDKSTRTSRIPDFHRFWPRSEILHHDPGLAARPPVRYTLRVAGSECSPCLLLSVLDGQAPPQAVTRPPPRCPPPPRAPLTLRTQPATTTILPPLPPL